MHKPNFSADVAKENEHMAWTRRRHHRRRIRAGKPANPVRRKIEVAFDFAKQEQRGFTAAECARASCWTATDHSSISVGVDCGRVTVMLVMMMVVVSVVMPRPRFRVNLPGQENGGPRRGPNEPAVHGITIAKAAMNSTSAKAARKSDASRLMPAPVHARRSRTTTICRQ